jgi:hypothetical protein
MLAGRRRHERFALAQRCTGALRVLTDAVVQHAPDGSLLAITHAPCVAEERLTLDVAGDGASMRVDVMVTDSRPVIIDGSVRHRVTLLIQEANAASTDDVAAVVA